MNYPEFKRLLAEWTFNTAASSNPHRKHPNRNKILELAKGEEKKVSSYCLLLMGTMSLHECLWLLADLMPKEDHPVIPKEYYGCMHVIREMYRATGYKRRYIHVGYDPHKYWDESSYDHEAREDHERQEWLTFEAV